eukprot:6090592-Karenia_brevis.AAC.1
MSRIEDYIRIYSDGPVGMDIGKLEEKREHNEESNDDQSQQTWSEEGTDLGAVGVGNWNPNIQCWMCWGYGHP